MTKPEIIAETPTSMIPYWVQVNPNDIDGSVAKIKEICAGFEDAVAGGLNSIESGLFLTCNLPAEFDTQFREQLESLDIGEIK